MRELRINRHLLPATASRRLLSDRRRAHLYARLPPRIRALLERDAAAEVDRADAMSLVDYRLNVMKADPVASLADAINCAAARLDEQPREDWLLLMHEIAVLAWVVVRPLAVSSELAVPQIKADDAASSLQSQAWDAFFVDCLARLLERPTGADLMAIKTIAAGVTARRSSADGT